MDDFDHDQALDTRLAAMEARVPAPAAPTLDAATGRRRGRRLAASMTLAPILLIAAVATTAATAAVVGNLAKGYPGIQNEGQPLAGAHMECMSPPDAATFLAEHGFTEVIWQVESGEPDVGGQKGRTVTVQQPTAPLQGYVVPGSLMDDGTVLMVVDQRVGATGTGACVDLPMP